LYFCWIHSCLQTPFCIKTKAAVAAERQAIYTSAYEEAAEAVSARMLAEVEAAQSRAAAAEAAVAKAEAEAALVCGCVGGFLCVWVYVLY
jgi:uncharacterized membrane protein YgcG